MSDQKKVPSKRRGRSARDEGLTKDRIIEFALALIDEKGASSFSLRDLARALEVYPTAIYWHVPNRDALIVEVIAFALGDLTPTNFDSPWKPWVKELCHSYRSAVAAHPNIAPLLGSQMVSNASLSPLMIERLLAKILEAGFKEQHLIHVFNTVITTMVSFVTLEFASKVSEQPDRWMTSLKNRYEGLDKRDFPVLTKNLQKLSNNAFVVRWEGGTNPSLKKSYEYYIDTVLSGLERSLKS